MQIYLLTVKGTKSVKKISISLLMKKKLFFQQIF